MNNLELVLTQSQCAGIYSVKIKVNGKSFYTSIKATEISIDIAEYTRAICFDFYTESNGVCVSIFTLTINKQVDEIIGECKLTLGIDNSTKWCYIPIEYHFKHVFNDVPIEIEYYQL